jgi:hypothetical protein
MINKNLIIISHRCFFPKAAFFWPTDKIARFAEEIGYDGIEFLPTWRFVWEMKKYGRLLAAKSMVASGHRDWRIDRVYLARFDKKPDWAYQFREKADLLFPPTGVCLSALKKFQRVYKKPVSTTWFDDTNNFSPAMLEVHGYKCGVGERQLFGWLKSDPKNHGLVLDTTKFPKWLESIGKDNKKDEILKRLTPFISEVHYRQIRKDNKWFLASFKEGERMLKSLIRSGYRGRVVVEFGWPDLDVRPFGLFKEDLENFKKMHYELIAFIKNI